MSAHQSLRAPFDAVIEATVQRSRPVIPTALAAMLAFIPLTHSVFWGTLAYTLIGGTFGGTALTLVFLPALYAIWFKIKPAQQTIGSHETNRGTDAAEESNKFDQANVSYRGHEVT